MKKFIALAISVVLIVAAFSSCGGKTDNTSTTSAKESANNGKLKIVCTIFPEYDWVREILGRRLDNADVTLLLDNGVDLHNYQPTADDVIKISSCDMFIYVGGESDKWVKDALKEKTNDKMAVIDLMEVLAENVKEEEVIEGMESVEEEPSAVEEEGPEYDEHVWLSLRNAEVICANIAEKLSTLDADGASEYKKNADNYVNTLKNLDAEYKNTVDASKTKTLLFGDRFPFRYLADDYGIKYFAAFVGCSAETEASFETIAFLSKKVDELGLTTILTLEGSDGKIAGTIKQNTKDKSAKILALDSMQSRTSEDVKNGVTYLSVMQKNLSVIKDALN